ncbi:MAG: archease [Candidatus Aminicenantes bacterium]|nr:archease [Candidatus Aminicenantes bacterium]
MELDEKFRFLDHTADAMFQAFGRTLEEAFANAVLATVSLMWDPGKVEKRARRPVNVEGMDLEQILVRFLGEVVYLWETRGFLTAAAEDVCIDPSGDAFRLNAVFLGDDRPQRYEVFGDVKAVTYNEMKIERGRPASVQVVLDI